jgi:nucleoside-diphosphate-sugar epimerase
MLILTYDHFEEIIIPAVKGTTSILHSVLKYGTSVKRVVVTSSTVAIFHTIDRQTIYTENNWSDAVVSRVYKLGREAKGIDKYSASKTLAEKGF